MANEIPPGIKAYGKGFSLDELRTNCEQEEGRGKKLMSLVRGNNGEVDVTFAKYEDVKFLSPESKNLGNLIIEEYKPDPAETQKAIHKANEEPFVCEGKAWIQNGKKDVIVFRKKKP